MIIVKTNSGDSSYIVLGKISMAPKVQLWHHIDVTSPYSESGKAL